MQQFTFAFVMSMLQSMQLKKSVASAVFFGAKGSLRGKSAQLESFTRTIRSIEEKYPERAEKMRSSEKHRQLTQEAELAANRAAAIHAIAEMNGIMLTTDFEPPLPKPKTNAELELIASSARMDKETVKQHMELSDSKQYHRGVESADLASSLFWTACADSDAPVKFETVGNAIERTRLQLLTWSRIDFAEMALIAKDEDSLNDWMSTMSDDPRQFQEDDDVIEERQRKAEIAALDAHARQQATIQYLDAERAKANKPRRTRAKKQAA